MRDRYIGRFGIWKMSWFLIAYISSMKYESFTINGSKEFFGKLEAFCVDGRKYKLDVSEERKQTS